MIEIIEPDRSSHDPEGLRYSADLQWMMCDCSAADQCPNGPKAGMAPRCQFLIAKTKLKKKARKLAASQSRR